MATNSIVHESIHEIQKYEKALQGNKSYVQKKLAEDPDYFTKLAKGQTPKYLLIGCSDSRAPPNEITETDPGEIFIHRNIANVVVPTDLNINCVIQYAIEHLKVHNIVIMGHTFCGGVKAAMKQESVGGLLDLWLNQLKMVYEKHQDIINQLDDEDERVACLSCMNVREQVMNVWKNPIVQRSWQAGHPVMVHGWLFRVETGYIQELEMEESIPANMSKIFQLKFKNIEPIKQKSPEREDDRSKSPSIRRKMQRMQSTIESGMRRATIHLQNANDEVVEKTVVDYVQEVLQDDFKQIQKE